MTKSVITTHDNGTALVVDTPLNVDGKGANGFLLDWYRTEPRGVVVKPQRQVLAEFFTSMLVLSAHFKYEPAVGVQNYLYWIDGGWSLSLIAPDEWSEERRAGFAGTCELQPDMTWTIEPSEHLKQEGPITDAVGRFFDAFTELFDTDLTIEDILPFYVQRMPYWQRLYANALSRSIRGTVTLADKRDLSAREWRLALPKSNTALLGSSSSA